MIGIITAFVIGMNCGYAALQVHLLRRLRPYPKALSVAVCLWAFAMSALFTLAVFAPANWKPFLLNHLYLPTAVAMVWNILFLRFLVPGIILVTLWIRRTHPIPPDAAPVADGISRRRFVYLLSYGAVPATTLAMGVHGTVTRNDLRVREFRIPIVGLPPELEGFSIAHVSDLHSGIFCGPERLKIIGDTANDLKADLVAITGDIINHALDEFPAALTAMKSIESRHGTYLCEGNHDLIAGPRVVADLCNANGLPMLYHSNVVLPINGRRLVLAGLPWIYADGSGGNKEMVSRLFPARQKGDVRILLAHHPHRFDIADSADLVLSGHSHGGQIMFGDTGLGPLFFKYWSGLYQRGNTSLVVSNGGGDWFPCRIGAPAEIGLLRLTKA